MNNVSLLMKEMLMLHRLNHNIFEVSVLLKRLDFNRELAVMTRYVGNAVMRIMTYFYKLQSFESVRKVRYLGMTVRNKELHSQRNEGQFKFVECLLLFLSESSVFPFSL
jgi:hypothetical protein